MKIKEIQDRIRDALNGCEKLVQGGCKAFSEDSREVYDEANQWISGGGVAVVVVTPRLTRNGANPAGLPMEGPLLIRCIEAAAISSAQSTTMRALDAAEEIAHELDGETFNWIDIEQTADQQKEVFTATCRFNYSTILTR